MSLNVSRRSFLRAGAAGVAAAAIAPALAACGSGSTGSTSNIGAKLAPWPTYVPTTTAKYDLPALPNSGAPAVLGYPQLPLPASVSAKPGDGSTVTALTVSYGAAVSTGSSNQLLAAVSQALGVTFQPRFVIDTGTSYGTAVATIEASGDMPDLIMVNNGIPNVNQFVSAKCADLTPYLSGDAIKDYPNLASIPTRGWELMGRIGGKILAVPIYRYNKPSYGLVANKDKLTAAGIWGPGLSVDQFAQGMQKLKAAGQSPMGDSAALPFGWLFHAGAAGAPYNWKQENGKFTHAIDTPEFQQALVNMHGFYTQGLFNPDALSVGAGQAGSLFVSGAWTSSVQGLGGLASTFGQVGSSFAVDVAYPYGSKPNAGGGDSIFGYIAIKQGSPDRIKMLLRVLDFLAAPFGSKEFELINYGVEGTHFTRGADGSPANPTALGKTENNVNIPLKYLGQQPQPLFFPGAPKITQTIYDAYKQQLPIVVADAAVAYSSGSATYSAKNAGTGPAVNSAIADIVSGRQPLSSWSGTVAQLKTQFSLDQMAAELGQAYAAAAK